MPIRTVPGSDAQYHLICFDANGVERAEPDGTLLSDLVAKRLASTDAPITDVFFCSHGWQGDVPAAVSQYDKWVGEMAKSADVAVAHAKRPGFASIVIGIHWPSLPFGDEAVPEGGGVLGDDEDKAIEAQVAQFAASIVDTPTARAAMRVILIAAARDDGERETLPDHVRDAYEELAREADLPRGGSNPGGAPGEEQGEWDADAIYAEARASATVDSDGAAGAINGAHGPTDAPVGGVLGGGFFGALKGLLVAPLQQASFWKMKERARLIGEGGAHALLIRLQQSAPPTARFHLMGHSFGCIVMSATVAGAADGPPLVRPIDSLFLVQGALSLWSYSPDIPVAPGSVGYFNRTLTNGFVNGPIVTTQSRFDRAVGMLYPTAVRVKSQFVLGDELPKYGGVGTFGIQGIGAVGESLTMGSVDHAYAFHAGHVYNLESSDVIKTSSGMASGAHSDIAHPEVAHAMWQAVLAGVA
jgi:hypothetical protein